MGFFLQSRVLLLLASPSNADAPAQRLPSNRGEPPLATPLVRQPGTQDFATRVGRAVAKRTGKPAHVGCSMVLAGSSVEEEAAALKAAVEAIMGALENDEAKVNGVKG